MKGQEHNKIFVKNSRLLHLLPAAAAMKPDQGKDKLLQ
jgi:hypothetical protein